jgi:hypothetical protein
MVLPPIINNLTKKYTTSNTTGSQVEQKPTSLNDNLRKEYAHKALGSYNIYVTNQKTVPADQQASDNGVLKIYANLKLDFNVTHSIITTPAKGVVLNGYAPNATTTNIAIYKNGTCKTSGGIEYQKDAVVAVVILSDNTYYCASN